jgi:hypothetical protein
MAFSYHMTQIKTRPPSLARPSLNTNYFASRKTNCCAKKSARRNHQNKSADAERLSNAAADRGAVHDYRSACSSGRFAHDDGARRSRAPRAIDAARADNGVGIGHGKQWHQGQHESTDDK